MDNISVLVPFPCDLTKLQKNRVNPLNLPEIYTEAIHNLSNQHE